MRYTLLLFILLLSLTGKAQMIYGKVLSERGLAASSISVKFINKANAVVTNPDGTFKILATKLPDTLIFSAPGVEPYKVVVTEKTLADPNFEIVLLDKRETLEDVVVTGYSTVKKKDVTGSVAYARSAGKASTKARGEEVIASRVYGTKSEDISFETKKNI